MSGFNYEGQRVLILAPHADDETIGCGGIIQKFIKSNCPVRVVIASFVADEYKKFKKEEGVYQIYSGKKRLEEVNEAFRILGIRDFHFIFMEESKPIQYHSLLDTIPRIQLVTKIEEHIQQFDPTILFIPSKTKHQDHAALHEAGITAARPYFWSGSILVYETDGELDFVPNLFVSLSEEEMQTKLNALKAYKTQLGKELHPVNPTALSIKARYRGQCIYESYAEAFQILRLHG